MKTDELRLTHYGQWIRLQTANQVCVGITADAQQALGEIVYLELPRVGEVVKQDQPCGFLESRKAVVDILAPVSGVVVAQNLNLLAQPTKINESPYQQGWLFTLQIEDIAQWQGLPVYTPLINERSNNEKQGAGR